MQHIYETQIRDANVLLRKLANTKPKLLPLQNCAIYHPTCSTTNKFHYQCLSAPQTSSVWYNGSSVLQIVSCDTRSNQTKDYNIRICCFSAKHTERAKTGWLGGFSIMCASGATFLHSLTVVSVSQIGSITIQLSALIQHKTDIIIISPNMIQLKKI